VPDHAKEGFLCKNDEIFRSITESMFLFFGVGCVYCSCDLLSKSVR
jgi:hypothetical protein